MRIRDVGVTLLSANVPPEHQHRNDFGVVRRVQLAIVRVDTDQGISGYGEAKGSPAVMKTIVERELRPLLVGEDPTQIERLWQKMYNGSRLELALYHGHTMPILGNRGETLPAISGVEVALWDIFGKSLNLPIYRLLGGGCRRRIRCYASGGWAPPEKAGDEARGYLAQGFKAIKMRVGGMDHPRIVEGSLARVRAVREAIGPDVELMVDAHGTFGTSTAIAFARRAEEYNLSWFEEPVPCTNLRGMAEIRRATSIPISTGENEFTRFDFKKIIEAEAAEVLQPDIAITGGLSETRKICDLASAWSLRCAPHVWGSALLWAASLQLAAAVPNYFLFEFCQSYNPMLYDLITTPVKVEEDGFVTIPDQPGLGIELQPDLERKYPFD